MRPEPLILLTTDTNFGRIAAHYLAARFSNLHILVEQRVSRWTMLRGRTRRLGLVRVAGQIAFMAYGCVLTCVSQQRINDLIARFAMDDRWPEGTVLTRLPSVNSPTFVGLLQNLEPRAVLVVGTRIISPKILTATPVPFINYHDGITPKYRGIRGGYWAKAECDLENFGVTVHLVDAGIDTGAVLYQSRTLPDPQDNYATFSYLQLATALPLLEQAALDALDGKLTPKAVDLPSSIWSHPTIWGYVLRGLRRGAW
jgi:phosphoribosylglycinamide formyltransferase-1